MFTPFSGFFPQGEGWVACLIPTGLGELVYVHAPLGWSSSVYGFLPPGKQFSELLPPGGQVGCIYTLRWESGFTLVNSHWVIDNIKRSKYYQGKAK